MQDWRHFSYYLYTPSEYARDEGRGKGLPYIDIYFYFSRLSQEQQRILRKNQDAMAFRACLPRFPQLIAIRLSFVDGINQPFRSLGGSVFLDWKDSFPTHLINVVEGMGAAMRNEVVIRTFEVSGFYSQLAADNKLFEGMASALHYVEDLRLIDSPSLLEFMSTLTLPSIHRLELENCWLCVRDLEDFVNTHAKTLQFLHLEDTWLPVEKDHHWGLDSTAHTVLMNIASIKERGVLKKLTINRENEGRYQYQEVFGTHLAE